MQIFIIFLAFYSVLGDDECRRPIELKTKEEYCWHEEVEVVDRIVQTSKNVLNFAKKKLGITVDQDNNEKQKCEYYLCILRQLHMLSANDYPACEEIRQWAKNNVIYNQAIDFIQRLEICYEDLNNKTLSEVYFYADQVDKDESLENSESTTENPAKDSDPNKAQSVCEISSEFIKCLSRQKQCPVFEFP
ncbi:uncharacterized protein LOC123006577 [Tribolium madens]|uniref:uncharacterized protein LOC123006577 n=1 Tax=Tribolium madens TaxID=41895 RepID=UPI001CF72C9F|nr:uncharacterized protein LOC123006577 [Tribolium madens]